MGLSAPAIASRKVRDGGEPLVMVTAYDAPALASRARPVPTSFSSATPSPWSCSGTTTPCR